MLSAASSSSSIANPKPLTTVEMETIELKRKLAMVTEELSLNRTNHAKKSRTASTSRGLMVIKKPGFPMEYYQVAEQARTEVPFTSLRRWFESFNNSQTVQKQPQAYHNWIQTRTVDLLPKVLTVIGKQLTEPELLSLRLVSKSWKQSVDQFLQDSVPLDLPICTEPNLRNIASTIWSDNYQSILKMLNSPETKQHPGNLTPFPSGHLFIHCLPGIEIQYERAFANALEILLEFYGETVQSFTFLDYRSNPDISWVSSWLKKMPNLKRLQIDILGLCSGQGDDLLIPTGFPRLPKLITFVGSFAPPKLTDEILRLNPEIRNLGLISVQPNRSILRQLHLTSLSVQMSSVEQFWFLLLHLQSSPLEKLRLTDELDSDGMDLEGVPVFQTLSLYGGALKELYLDLKVTRKSFIWNLKLPRLQRLYVHLRKSSFLRKMSYDFLLPLESLEFLEIELEASGESNQGEKDVNQVIQLFGYFHRLYESNIWKLFPRLKKVDIRGRFGDGRRHFIYTREKLLEKEILPF